jgi:hypothetical protein
LRYDLLEGRLFGASAVRGGREGPVGDLTEIPIPEDKRGGWRCEAEFVEAVRDGAPVRFTTFAAGVQYMEFTEAVARSAQYGSAVGLPL